MATKQQRLPWAPREREELPFEIPCGFCRHHRLVGFWQTHPTRGQARECNTVEVRLLGAHALQRELARMCPFGCIPPPPGKGAVDADHREGQAPEGPGA